MNPALLLALMVAAIAAGFAFYVGRAFVSASTTYRQTFQDSAEQNLAEMFLFIDPQKLFAMNIGLMFVVFFVVLLLGGGWVLAGITTLIFGISPPFLYRFLRKRRQQRAVEQLPDALLSIATNLRSGLSLNQALETTITHEHPPLGQELALVLRELRVGVNFNEALDNLYFRIPVVEVQLVVSAMKVSREIGGNLSEALERISDTLRKRLQMEGKIKSLTAQGKLQGIVMTGLPIFLVLTLTQMEPQAMNYLFHAWYGWLVILVIVVLEIIGYHFIKKIVSIDV